MPIGPRAAIQRRTRGRCRLHCTSDSPWAAADGPLAAPKAAAWISAGPPELASAMRPPWTLPRKNTKRSGVNRGRATDNRDRRGWAARVRRRADPGPRRSTALERRPGPLPAQCGHGFRVRSLRMFVVLVGRGTWLRKTDLRRHDNHAPTEQTERQKAASSRYNYTSSQRRGDQGSCSEEGSRPSLFR